jgi:transposase
LTTQSESTRDTAGRVIVAPTRQARPRRYLSKAEVAARYGVSHRSIQKWVAWRWIPRGIRRPVSDQHGKRRFWSLDQLEAAERLRFDGKTFAEFQAVLAAEHSGTVSDIRAAAPAEGSHDGR